MAEARQRARLLLEDGTEFEGLAFGATNKSTAGELGKICHGENNRNQSTSHEIFGGHFRML